MVGTFRNGVYDALVDVLKARRKALKLTQIAVAGAMPKWLGFDHTMLNKIEHRTRDITYVEVRELAKVLQTTIAQLDAQTADLESAHRKLQAEVARMKGTRKKK